MLEDPKEQRDSLLQKLRQRIKERDQALEVCVAGSFTLSFNISGPQTPGHGPVPNCGTVGSGLQKGRKNMTCFF